MKLIYLFVFITLIVILLFGRSIFSSVSAVSNSASSSLGQSGGKKSSNLRTLLFVVLAIFTIVLINSYVENYFTA